MRNLWHNKQRLLPLLALLLGTQSCFNQNDFDTTRIAGLKASPSVAVPLLHGSLSMEDLLAQTESQYVAIDEDKLIHLMYSDTLYSTSIRDHFLLPVLSAEKFYLTGAKTLTPGNSQTIVEDQVFLDFKFGEIDFNEIRLKAGDVSLSASTSVDADVEFQLTFPTLNKQGQPLQITLSLPATGTPQSVQLSLRDYIIDMNEYGAGENLVPVNIRATVTPTQQSLLLSATDYVQFSLGIDGMNFTLITGHFGQLGVSLPQKEMALEFFETIFNKANFSLESPKFYFDFLNSNGATVEVTKDLLQARKEAGETLPITTDPADLFNISAPARPGETSVTRIAITNVGEIVDFAPAFMDYKLSGKLNVGMPPSTVNFVTDSSRSGVIFHADIPLWGSLEGFTLSDTMAMTLQSEDAQLQENGNGSYKIENAKASVRTVIANQFPLGAEVQVYFTNALYEISDSLFTEGPLAIKSSKVNATGDLQSEEVTTLEPSISDKQLERILEADHMIVKALLYTTRNADGTQPAVKIKSNYKMDIKLGLKASMNISVKPNL